MTRLSFLSIFARLTLYNIRIGYDTQNWYVCSQALLLVLLDLSHQLLLRLPLDHCLQSFQGVHLGQPHREYQVDLWAPCVQYRQNHPEQHWLLNHHQVQWGQALPFNKSYKHLIIAIMAIILQGVPEDQDAHLLPFAQVLQLGQQAQVGQLVQWHLDLPVTTLIKYTKGKEAILVVQVVPEVQQAQ